MQRTKTRLFGIRARGRDDVAVRPDAAEMPRKSNPDAGKLAGQAKLLLTVHAVFAFANALSGTFVNVYIWKVKNDFALIGWFAFAHQAAMAATFWLAGKWVKESNKMNSLRLGVAVSALFYLLVLTLGRLAADHVVLLGLLQGSASGFFWLAFNIVYFEITDAANRDRFNGMSGLLGSASGMIAPWISGYLIARLNDSVGYPLIFALSLAVFVVGIVVSFFLKKRKIEGRYEWLKGFRELRLPRSPWRLIVPALVAQGTREGVFGFIIGLLVYVATKREMSVGNYSLITSAAAIVSFWLAGRVLRHRHRNVAMLVGVVMMVVVIFPFFWNMNYKTLLIFGLGSALFFPLFAIPMTSTVFDVIGRTEESARHREEYVVLRELSLCAGRMAGTLAFIATVGWTRQPWAVSALLLALGVVPLWTWVCMRKLHLRSTR